MVLMSIIPVHESTSQSPAGLQLAILRPKNPSWIRRILSLAALNLENHGQIPHPHLVDDEKFG